MSLDAPPRIHETAVIDEGATIGAATSIWHFCHVRSGARIGARCTLGQNVYVGDDVVIGDGVKVQNNVSLFDGVRLDDDVFVGPSVVFTNVRTPRSHIPRRDAFEPTRVRRGATLGANATVVCGVEIGEYALVGAGTVVTSDVAPHALVVGNPARRIGWACQCGLRLPGNPSPRCASCGANYEPGDPTASDPGLVWTNPEEIGT